MFAILGILLVFGAVIGGFLMEKGQLLVLVQPAEFITIGGAALGTLIAANPLHVLKGIFSGLTGTLAGNKFTQQRYTETLKMMYELFSKARKEGLVAVESDIEEPEKSPLFSKYPAFLKDHHIRDFVCDTLRVAIIGGTGHFEMDQMMELDLEVHHHDSQAPTSALTTVADALPGLGIVAAVLGIVVTMGALGGPPEQIGHKVAAALVGTFLGILLCYGVLGPLSSSMGKRVTEEQSYYHVLRVVLLSFIKGLSPTLAVEMARRAVPSHVRPSFKDVEGACRGRSSEAAAG
jgi:chemotaxis protein MotA